MFENETTFLRKDLFNTFEKRRSRGRGTRGVILGAFFVFTFTFLSCFIISKIVVFPTDSTETHKTSAEPKKKLVAFVGVQTGFTKKDAGPQYIYEDRREVLRKTWFPSPKSALDKFEEEKGIRVRFVIGHTSDEEAERKVNAEQEEHDDFVRLDFQERYKDLAFKTFSFLRYVVDHFDVQYIVKADDDIYLALPRLILAAPQWKERGADYIGCMVKSRVLWREQDRWYEPQHALLGPNYFAYALGSVYILSGKTIETLLHIPEGKLRLFNNEDTTIGGWMVALNVSHFDDRRLCSQSCQTHTLALFYSNCAGLCSPATEMPILHSNNECNSLSDTLPILEESIPVSGAHSRPIQKRKKHHAKNTTA